MRALRLLGIVLLGAACSSESAQRVIYLEADGQAGTRASGTGGSGGRVGTGGSGATPDAAGCEDCDGDGYTKLLDCNDSNPDVHPGASGSSRSFVIDPAHTSAAGCRTGAPCFDYDCDGTEERIYGGTFDHGCSGEPLCCTDLQVVAPEVLVTYGPGQLECGREAQGFNGGYLNEARGCWELHTPVSKRQPC